MPVTRTKADKEGPEGKSQTAPPGKILLTSTEVAQTLGVGVSSVKRWTGSGKFPSVRTVGGHRRYTLAGLHEFAASQNLATHRLPPLDIERYEPIGQLASGELFERLLASLRKGDALRVRGYLAQLMPEGDERVEVLDRLLSPLLREIGALWQAGRLGIEEEHRASHIVADAMDRLRMPVTPLASRPRRALLACPPGEWHELALRMVRLVAEWNGWETDYLGANVPWTSIAEAVRKMNPGLLLLSSRASDPFVTPSFNGIVHLCAQQNVLVAIGGSWARGGSADRRMVARFRTLKGFQKWLRSAE
ncbi:MAG TPA: B12-binding domain-containing protein [Thermoanaerobaculia bacterium]|nr:B12-binding domain-containing protein [Thermoanaerobaculia bacterium]